MKKLFEKIFTDDNALIFCVLMLVSGKDGLFCGLWYWHPVFIPLD